KSEKSCDKRGQLSLLKLPSVARILSKAKKSVLSVGNKQKINKISRVFRAFYRLKAQRPSVP
ncbi:MAG: hypothetical protein IKT77_07985, partial [Paludibacteraceae bacterium]|nr:hypothetical protein [Paludibacteraceae bacterium]